MSYSISLVLDPYADKNGMQLVRIQVLHNRQKAVAKTAAKIQPQQFDGSRIVNHPKQTKINAAITAQVAGIEDRLLDALRKTPAITREKLTTIVKGTKVEASVTFITYADGLQQSLKGKVSPGRLKHYKVVAGEVDEFKPGIKFSEISVPWLNKFEAHLRAGGIAPNTLNSKMSMLLAILRRAIVDDLMQEDQVKGYKRPPYVETLPVYLTEAEIKTVYDLVQKLGDNNLKLTGYYFLLSCYAGYRISDARKFNYDERVQDGQIVLRAAKNGRIVSIPVHKRLKPILAYIKTRPIQITEQHMRLYVKNLCGMVGIKKDVIFHTSRHSFAMLLMKSGFTIDDVAYLLGDTPDVARVYAKIHNPTLNAKVKKLLG